MVLQMDRAATRVELSPAAHVACRDHFDRHHWLRLPKLLGDGLMRDAQRRLAAASFSEIRHTDVTPPSIDVCMEPNALSGMLELLCNDPAMLRTIETLTGCAPLTRFSGFVYRLLPDTEHHHNWHNDLIQERRLAMSINLEAEPYEGGVLQIRERESGRIIEEVANTGPGDAIVFRIDAALQHRATAVTRGVKTAFAGWFRSAEPLHDVLRQAAGD
jgi:hypothetical protein